MTPWELYRAVSPLARVSFFLDSHDYLPPNQVFSYVGLNPFLELTLRLGEIRVTGEENNVFPAARLLNVLRNLSRKYHDGSASGKPFFTGGAMGYWGYELVSLFEKIRLRSKPGPAIPWLYLAFYRELMVYDHRQKIYWLVANVFSKGPLPKHKAQAKADETFERLKGYFRLATRHPEGKQEAKDDFELKNFRPDISKRKFEHIVKCAQNYIVSGDIYQANLSQRFSFRFRGNALKLYGHLRKINPSPFAAYLKFGDFHILSSSPERLIRKRGSRCETLPIAGTRPRHSAHQSENKLIRDLMTNEKERAEHVMLVDLERNDLGRVCHWPSVKVRRMMMVEKYSHVIHLVSKITGIMKKDKDPLDLIRAMFPGGTITGCPKIRCMEIIDELEPVRRGIYTGSIGYLDFRGDLDLNIVIRTIMLQKNRGHLQVGAGIVYDSDPTREYEETLHKGEALVEALVQSSL